ncbi:MAG: amino acid permease [Planctomycetaceae bacterium]|nr:amino acid permease [Planctomycetaceae bacterium]
MGRIARAGDNHAGVIYSAVMTIGFYRATIAGIGATVGGGIFILSGIGWNEAGPGIILAFLLNALLAASVACAFSEMSTAFPQSGGAYVFAKCVLAVRPAFATGWVLWFAYVVAGALYAMGFSAYAVIAVDGVCALMDRAPPPWLMDRYGQLALAALATAGYAILLVRAKESAGFFTTLAMLLVFLGLVVGGVVVIAGGGTTADASATFTPLFPGGAAGIAAAMGYTFITMQGFEVIAAFAGEVKQPRRNLPRAMFTALFVSAALYIGLLLVTVIAGVDDHARAVSASEPHRFMAVAVENFLGAPGYWATVVITVLASLSALQGNLLAASRVALTMAKDRTLPRVLAKAHSVTGVPTVAVYVSALLGVTLIILLPDLGAAGSAASLIFLLSYALAASTSYLARKRGSARRGGFLAPLFPLIPAVGGIGCVALAIFQAWLEPVAALIVLGWLGIGAVLYLRHFAARAEAVDAHAEARDPELVQLRGRSPLVLVPVANPTSARALIGVATALAPPKVGRVLLLNVVEAAGASARIELAQATLREALTHAVDAGCHPEALMTISPQTWGEIARVAQAHRCESLLLGFTQIPEGAANSKLEGLLSEVECDIAVLRAPVGWNIGGARNIIVPVAGGGTHDRLRARLLASLTRLGKYETVYLRVLRENASEADVAEAQEELDQLAREEVESGYRAEVIRARDVPGTLVEHAAKADLVVLGLQQLTRKRNVFGSLALRIAHETQTAMIMIGRK